VSCASQALSEFHVLLLYGPKMQAVNAVSQAVVQEIALIGRSAQNVTGTPAGMAVDATAGIIYMYTGAAAAAWRKPK
jgi:Pep3/Vps18/deep orange family